MDRSVPLHITSFVELFIFFLLAKSDTVGIGVVWKVTRSVNTDIGQLSSQERSTIDAIVKARSVMIIFKRS